MITVTITNPITPSPAKAQLQNPFVAAVAPKILDSKLEAELVYGGPGFPTNMAR